jgi:hypothetical protein
MNRHPQLPFIGVMGVVFLGTGLLRLRSKAKYPEVN